ncbi:ATP-binding protein [Streptomyces sp. CC208A]|uniref:ATP-binding protein n=1 Tax=Streptomyces sp. CC208A TaxID=3044573 RepID=UPI0024A95C7A|nr:ATP-binding protein [Streptomyces sp. CC208A]
MEKGPHSGNLASGLPVLFHGRVQGRDFRIALTCEPASGGIRVEVTDPRGERLPTPPPDPEALPPGTESGRGLLLVAALADRWGTEPFPPGGKTVWAEIGPWRMPLTTPVT